ncbi:MULTISPECIES: hypothetical protein [Klebsiella]|uniref:Uncharacterized protein n=1 Tax=Klebsiella pneumoniae TaxID=573 RepID=A0A483LR81_KLEPN|nr:hypothetical protein [Klebsiella pneumoniae]EIX9440307.1 hypothetical protein [Klebsiella pneumoniae]EJO3116732.1 hypothetical protein [Klebsiella pneumoniae]EKW2589846.1 hypothetical protein [Klebsiella pneumoniae]MBD7734516.1 hypothetical protein [Klebsiella pneumoniae]MBE0164667.1 hypothetical protein [Klebsiella pneumoniae]
MTKKRFIYVIVFILFVVFILFSAFTSNPSLEGDRESIKACISSHGVDDSICKKMVNTFKEKYGVNP